MFDEAMDEPRIRLRDRLPSFHEFVTSKVGGVVVGSLAAAVFGLLLFVLKGWHLLTGRKR